MIPVTIGDTDGVRVYRRSLAFLMVDGGRRGVPGRRGVHRALGDDRRRVLLRGARPGAVHPGRAAADRAPHAGDRGRGCAAFAKTQVPVAEAIGAVPSRAAKHDKARLLAHREKDTLTLYSLRGRQRLLPGLHGALGRLPEHFALHAFPPGFMLQFPHQSRPTELAPITPYPKLFAVFEEAGHWLDRLGIRSAGALNDAIVAGRLPRDVAGRRGAARGAASRASRPTSPAQGPCQAWC